MKAFTQLIENKVMVSTLPKPKLSNYADEPHELSRQAIKEYEFDLAAFESSIIGEAENVAEIGGTWLLTDIRTHPQWTELTTNQPCEVEKSGDKWRITKLI